MIDGQRLPIARPRVRECGGKELPLGTYQLFQRVSPAEERVWSNIKRGLSMRDYRLMLQQFMDAYGLEKSTVSERFVEASRKKLEELMSRSLEYLQICALVIDGTIFKGRHLIGAHRHRCFGEKGGPGPSTRSDGERQGGQWVLRSSGRARVGFQPATAVSAGRKPRLAERQECAQKGNGAVLGLPE